jgi:hypothetical protein
MQIFLRRFFLGLILFATTLAPSTVFAQLPDVVLTDNAKVSLLTCSQGEELYSIFGHSAIRVADPQVGVDWVFNYGTFDFSDPKFYPNFVKGKLNYILSVSTYKNFERSYIFEGRYIYEQVLNLKQYEKQKLLDSLKVNYLPENRYYLYDFLFDNCATRIRDIFVESIPRDITFDYRSLDEDKSFRDLLMPNVEEKPWAKLGINLLLGVSADRKARPWEQMFLPEHMMTAFMHSGIKNMDDDIVSLMQEPTMLLKGNEIGKSKFRNGPLFTFILVLLFAVLVSYINLKKQRQLWWFDRILFGLIGLLGIVIAFQWFGSDHTVMANNYNLFWAHPLHLIVALVLTSSRYRKALKYYFGLNTILMIMLLALWFVLPQTLPLPMLPVVAAMGLRSAVIYKRLK